MSLPLFVGKGRLIWNRILGSSGLRGGWEWVLMPSLPTIVAACIPDPLLMDLPSPLWLIRGFSSSTSGGNVFLPLLLMRLLQPGFRASSGPKLCRLGHCLPTRNQTRVYHRTLNQFGDWEYGDLQAFLVFTDLGNMSVSANVLWWHNEWEQARSRLSWILSWKMKNWNFKINEQFLFI